MILDTRNTYKGSAGNMWSAQWERKWTRQGLSCTSPCSVHSTRMGIARKDSTEMFLRESIKTACPLLHIVWPRKEREANPFFGCCNYRAWSSQAVYLPAGDVTAPSTRKLHSSTLKSIFIIHELQNLKEVIKVFSNNNKKRNNCHSLN